MRDGSGMDLPVPPVTNLFVPPVTNLFVPSVTNLFVPPVTPTVPYESGSGHLRVFLSPPCCPPPAYTRPAR